MTQDTVVDGRYKIVNRIGSGGMADVWCAEDLQLGRKVALKLLHRRFAEDQDFVERFRREASAAAGLQHPNVVAVYDRGEWDGTYYIAMEYLEGETLKDLIVREAPLETDRAIDLTIQILRAARFAHKRGIIHRDLKPQNVMVDAEGRAKVTDFGIARAGASDMTETGSILGTAQYLSPEQAQGHAVTGHVGPLLDRDHPLRDGHRPRAVRRRQRRDHRAQAGLRGAGAAVASQPRGVARARERHRPRAGEGADRAVRRRGRVHRRARGRARRRGGRGRRHDGVRARSARRYAPLDDEPGRSGGCGALLTALLVAAAIIAAVLLTREETRPVPRVTGADVAAAARRLRNDGFRPVVERVRNDQPRDRVIAQDPRPGQELEVGDEVTLTVSDGPGTRAVPDVEGLSQHAQARSRLRDAGFRVREREEASEDVARGPRHPHAAADRLGDRRRRDRDARGLDRARAGHGAERRRPGRRRGARPARGGGPEGRGAPRGGRGRGARHGAAAGPRRRRARSSPGRR